MKKKVPVGMLVGLLVLVAVAAFNIAYIVIWNTFTERIENLNAREAAFNKLSEVAAYIDSYYVSDADHAKLTDGAVDGYVKALGDDGSYYFSTEESAKHAEADKLNYAGIGIVGCYDETYSGIRIIGMYEGSTAAEAGMKYLDVITRVSGSSVAYLGYETAMEHIRGEEGTEIKLTVYRESSGSYYEVFVRRGAVITERELKSELLEDNIGYIRLDNFSEGTDISFQNALDALREQGMESLIIDLRMNPGGYMEVMTNIADIFMGEGVVYREKRQDGEDQTIYAGGERLELKTVLIVNEYTLSAAEYFAAALQESGCATVVGAQTPGSGYAQSSISFSDGSVLVLSTTEYYTPNGYSLSNVGLTPDYSVKMSSTDTVGALEGTQYDTQLAAAKSRIK